MSHEIPLVSLKEVTQKTVWQIMNLKVAENQSKFVAPNAFSIGEAYFSTEAWFRAIYAGDEPVGFVMLYLDKEKPEYFLWRLMIAAEHQSKGYGYQAMELVIDHVKNLPNAKELLCSYMPGEGSPAPFYYKLGFEETGEWEDNEKVIRLALE